MTGSRTSKTAKVISALLIVAFLSRFFNLFLNGNFQNYNGFSFTEFLINFEAGFVRRGALGEALYGLCSATGISPFPVIIAICVAAWIAVLVFFFTKFRQKGYCWWFLLSPLVLGYTGDIIRKDFLCYLVVIAMMYLMARPIDTNLRCVALTLLGVAGMMLHEAFIFFGIPIVALFLFSDKSTRAWSVVFSVVSVACFLFLCHFKGDAGMARSIVDSWNSILPQPILEYKVRNSIGALGWGTRATMLFHLGVNIYNSAFVGYSGVVLRPLFAVCAYYMVTNFIFVFRRDSPQTRMDCTNLSMLYLLSLICLLPMFTVLSCDYIRIYQYAAVSSLAAFLMLPADRIARMFPRRFVCLTEWINAHINRVVIPTKGLMIILLFVMSPAPWSYSPAGAFSQSIIGTLFNLGINVMVEIRHLVM